MGINEVSEVKKLGSSSATAKVIATHLASRNRMRHETDTNRFKTLLKNEGEKIDDKEYDAFWKAAQKIELGSLDRKGRFRWHYNLKTVGAVATGEEPEGGLEKISKKPAAKPETVKRKVGRPAGSTKTAGVSQVAYFFKDQLLYFPLGMSQQEADKLSQFIKSIPSIG